MRARARRVKIIDFGLAMRQKTSQNTGRSADALAKTLHGASIAGTLDYAAPEQLGRLKARLGPHSDVYGFGRTLCYAVFGTPNPHRRHWRGLEDETLSDLLAACIEERPGTRPQDFDTVLQRLRSEALMSFVESDTPKLPQEQLPQPKSAGEQPSCDTPLSKAEPLYRKLSPKERKTWLEELEEHQQHVREHMERKRLGLPAASPAGPQHKPGDVCTNSLGMKFAWIAPRHVSDGQPAERNGTQGR